MSGLNDIGVIICLLDYSTFSYPPKLHPKLDFCSFIFAKAVLTSTEVSGLLFFVLGRKRGTSARSWLGMVRATGPDPFRHCSRPNTHLHYMPHLRGHSCRLRCIYPLLTSCVSLGGPWPMHSFSEWEKLLQTRYTTQSVVCAIMWQLAWYAPTYWPYVDITHWQNKQHRTNRLYCIVSCWSTLLQLDRRKNNWTGWYIYGLSK